MSGFPRKIGFRPKTSGTATETKETTASPSSAGGFISRRNNNGNTKRKTAFYCGGCKRRIRPT
jgi:hypothetical protein